MATLSRWWEATVPCPASTRALRRGRISFCQRETGHRGEHLFRAFLFPIGPRETSDPRRRDELGQVAARALS